MGLYLFSTGNHRFSVLLLFMLTLLTAPPAEAAELLPFPSRDRAPQQQQSAPRYRPTPQPDQEIERFRRDITTFPCPELDALYRQIKNQFDTTETSEDREYYNRFLSELYREKSGRCNQ